jgi:DNA-binding response OmpR family regulator
VQQGYAPEALAKPFSSAALLQRVRQLLETDEGQTQRTAQACLR